MRSGQWDVFPGLAHGFLQEGTVCQAPGKVQRMVLSETIREWVQVPGDERASDGEKHGSHSRQVLWFFTKHANVCVGRGK